MSDYTLAKNASKATHVPHKTVGPFGPRIRLTLVPASDDIKTVANSSLSVISPQPFARPSHPKQQPSIVLHRRAVTKPLPVVPDLLEEVYYEPAAPRFGGLASIFGRRRANFSVDQN